MSVIPRRMVCPHKVRRNSKSLCDSKFTTQSIFYYGVVFLPQLFQFDSTYMHTWSLQWAMLQRDLHVLSMSGIADITDKHPNGPTFKETGKIGDCV